MCDVVIGKLFANVGLKDQLFLVSKIKFKIHAHFKTTAHNKMTKTNANTKVV